MLKWHRYYLLLQQNQRCSTVRGLNVWDLGPDVDSWYPGWLPAATRIIKSLLCSLNSRLSKMALFLFFSKNANKEPGPTFHLKCPPYLNKSHRTRSWYHLEPICVQLRPNLCCGLDHSSLLGLRRNATIVWINLVSASGWRGKSKWQTWE